VTLFQQKYKDLRMKAQTLQLPGATLYYETRGSGPVLLLIAGGTDAGVFEGTDRYRFRTK